MTPQNELRLDDGFSTIIEFENLPMIKLYEKEVNPPSIGNNGPIDTTTMRNTAWRTAAPKKLKTLGKVTATCAYATESLADLQAQLGVNQRVTVRYPDGSGQRFWGWLDEANPSTNKEGDQPTLSISVVPSLRDLDGNEVGPENLTPNESDAEATA